MGYLLDTLEQGKLDGQRSVVKNERRWRVDNRPYGIWDERLYEMAFPKGHPYHHPVIGYMEDLDAATLSDVEAFFKTYYVPSNAVLTMAGQFSKTRARDLIRKYFGPIPSGERLRPRTFPAADPPGPMEDVRTDHVALPRLYLLYYGPAAGDPGCAEAEAAQYLIGEGRGSLLYRELVLKRALAASTSTTFMPSVGVSTMVVTVTGTPESRLEDLKSAAMECLDGLRSRGIPPEDARRARNRNLSYALMQWESLTQKANLLSEAVTLSGDPEDALRKAAQREKVSQEGLTALVNRMIAAPPVQLGFVPAP